MIRDLFSLKVRLNADLLTVELGAKTVTVTAERTGPDGKLQRLRKVLDLVELLAIAGDELEAVLVQVVEGVVLEG